MTENKCNLTYTEKFHDDAKTKISERNTLMNGVLIRAESYYTNGQVFSQCHYKDAKRTKEYLWHENARIMSESNFTDDKYEGIQYRWYISGQIMSQFKYENGKKITELRWREDGTKGW